MVVLMLVLATVSGCQSSSPRGGSAFEDEGFKIAVPAFTTEIKQGETQNITISLQRGKYFKQDVELRIEAAKGISVYPDKVIVEAGDKPDVQIRISASKDSAISEYRVSARGIPETGEPASTQFNVKVVSP